MASSKSRAVSPSIVTVVDVRDRLVGRDEPKPPGVDLQVTGHEPHAVGESVAITAHLDYRTGLDERSQAAAEDGALLPREPQSLKQLTDRRGMVHLFTNCREYLFSREHRQ